MKNRWAVSGFALLLVFVLFTAAFFLWRNSGGGLRVSAEREPETSEAEIHIPSWPVNLNTAGLEELEGIPGIGPVLAQRILDLRSETGGFAQLEDLLRVEGIGEKTLEAMEAYVCLEVPD